MCCVVLCCVVSCRFLYCIILCFGVVTYSFLFPDALSSFSNLDPDALERNEEIARATERLVTEVIPALAARLAAMSTYDISNLDLSVYFHSHGVNMRHLGLVRDHISPAHSSNPARTLLLLQIVTRTLKNICREYQRRWMKSEQSTSEMGMKLLLTQFMNLIVGSSQNSEIFWTERVVVGIIQRFGACSIDNNIEHLHRVRKLPDFLKVCFLTAQYHYSVSSSICQCYRR